MRLIGIMLLLTALVYTDELDIFDVVDNERNDAQSISNSKLNTRLKLSYLTQNKSSNEAVLYANMSNHGKNYFYDVRLVGSEDNIDIHIKDLYYKTDIDEKYFFEVGRMNVKEGVARGYNPTDYFRGSSSLTLSIDPKERKDNRLGSFLLQGTYISDNYTFKALYSPKISANSKSIWRDKKNYGLHLHESNAQERATLYLGYTGLDDWSMSALLHHNDDGLHAGANMSYIQERAIWYVESSLNKRENQITQALKSFNAPNDLVKQFDSAEQYTVEASLGINYTFENNIVTTFEYIYNEAGLDSKEWDNYFDLMHSRYAPLVGRARGVMASKSQILSKHSFFVMARKSDALPNFDWVAMGWVNPTDKSALAQVGLSYDYEDVLFSLDLRSYIGEDESEYGSTKNQYEALLSVEYFF